MIVTDFLTEVNDVLRSTDDDVPTIGSEEATYWLRTANRLKRNLYRDVTKQWRSTYQVLELGTISASSTPEFDLDDTFLSASDSCYVIDSAGSRHDYRIAQPQERDYLIQEVFIGGQDPQVLYFNKAILADDTIVGGTLYLPAYVMPDDFLTASATILVDDPDWLVIATAAKLAFGDLTYEDKAADLNAEANSLYRQMVKNNKRGTSGNPRTTQHDMTRIGTRGYRR